MSASTLPSFTFDPLSLLGFRSLLVLIFPFQAAIRSRSFNRTTCPRDINLAAQAVLKRPASIFGLVVLIMEVLVFTVLPSSK